MEQGVPLPEELDSTPAAERFLLRIDASGAVPSDKPTAAVASAVLCTFWQRLNAEQASAFFDATPAAVRGLLRACALHRDQRGEAGDRDHVLRSVASHVGVSLAEAERLLVATFAALQLEIGDEAEIDRLRDDLPAGLQELWTRAAENRDVTVIMI
jgi:uncharacterized protein (DUF2267 family)